jgi:glutamyl-tRNA reductase
MSGDLLFIGWNHRHATLDLREKLAYSPEGARDALEGLFREHLLSEGCIVSTCNRSEIYGITEREDGVPEIAEFLSRFHGVEKDLLLKTAMTARGDETVRHLFKVASGLDSMVLGEAQILGQIRESLRRAVEHGTARSVTNRLFQSAMECGKRVRTQTALGTRPASVPGIALSLTGRLFETLSGRRVLLIGAGETVELTARLLLDEGVTDIVFCNRTAEKAEALASVFSGRTVPWDQRMAAFADVDVVLSATGSPEPIAQASVLKKLLSRRRRGPLLVLDLAVPRDIEPEIDDIADVYRYDMDTLQELVRKNTLERQAEVPKATAIVEESVDRFLDWVGALAQVDVLKALRMKLEETRQKELERYASKLGKMSDEERELVQRITESLVAKILHEPTIALKSGEAAERLERAHVIKQIFRLGEGP